MESKIVENVKVMTTMNDVLEDTAGEVENVNDVIDLVQKVKGENYLLRNGNRSKRE